MPEQGHTCIFGTGPYGYRNLVVWGGIATLMLMRIRTFEGLSCCCISASLGFVVLCWRKRRDPRPSLLLTPAVAAARFLVGHRVPMQKAQKGGRRCRSTVKCLRKPGSAVDSVYLVVLGSPAVTCSQTIGLKLRYVLLNGVAVGGHVLRVLDPSCVMLWSPICRVCRFVGHQSLGLLSSLTCSVLYLTGFVASSKAIADRV